MCDDADIDRAVHWVIIVFSNAGQRCAATSRILVFKSVGDQFLSKLLIKPLLKRYIK